jgi:hypothetical protein
MEAGSAERDAIGVNQPADSIGWGKSGTFRVNRKVLGSGLPHEAQRPSARFCGTVVEQKGQGIMVGSDDGNNP